MISMDFKMDMSFSAEDIAGMLEAEKVLLGERNTLFESMVNKLHDFPDLRDMVYSILFIGRESSYNSLNETVGTAEMFGFIKNEGGVMVIANRIFEMVFYNLFLTSAKNQNRTRNMERTDVIVDYGGEQMVVELKIWRGNAYNERGKSSWRDIWSIII